MLRLSRMKGSYPGQEDGHTLEVPLVLRYDPARPPLRIAWSPEEVPPWDWTGGLSPWENPSPFLTQGGVDLAAPEGLSEARLRLAQVRFLGVRLRDEGWLGSSGSLGLQFPRLVRAAPHLHYRPPLERALPTLRKLGEKALKLAPSSKAWGEAVVEAASTVGLLDPYGPGDTLEGWWCFALEVLVWLDLPAHADFGTLEEVLRHLGEYPKGDTPEAKEAYRRAVRRVEAELWSGGGSLPPTIKEAGKGLWMGVLPQLFPHVALEGFPPYRARVGVRVWAMLELARAFTTAGMRICPGCGVPFVPSRRDAKTCGAYRCQKRIQRAEKRKNSNQSTAI